MIGGFPIVESRFVQVGHPIRLEQQIVAHPIDVLIWFRPDLDAVGRVMVLVDRIYDAAMRRLDEAMEVDR